MRSFFLWVAMWLGLGPAVSLAAFELPAIDLAEVQTNDGLFLGRLVSFWENTQEPLEATTMFTGALDQKFQPSLRNIPGPTFIQGELWLRIVIHNPESTPRSLVLESRYALTDHISLFQKDLNGEIRGEHLGDRSLFRTDPLPFRSPSFSIMAYPGSNVYYIRTSSRGPNILSLYLWRDAGFKGHRFVDTLIVGGLFGFLLALFFYNGFLALSLRSRTYAYYSLFLLCMILLQTAMQNMWPYLVSPAVSSWLENEGYVFVGSMTNFSGILVTIAFLSLKKNSPGFLRYFRYLLVFSLSPFALSLFAGFNAQTRLVSVTVGIGSLSMIVASIAAILRGYKPAAYYLLASVTFLVANILLTCNLLGIYHSPHVIQYGNFVGVVVQGLLMSLAVGYRVQFIRAEANRVIRGLNEELQKHLAQVEALVAERTDTIRMILDNVASGFMVVDPEGHIVKGFSQSCHQLLGQDVQEGQRLVDILDLDAGQRKIWNLAWTQIVQDLLPSSVALAQLPAAIRQKQRSLRLEVKILRNDAGGIKNLLVTIQDVTELKKQKRQARRHRVLIRILQDIEAFRQFIHHSHDFLMRLKHSTDRREQAFLLHTLKGNSSVFGLHAIARRLHDLEESRKLTRSDLEQLEGMFRDFLTTHDSILKTSWNAQEQQDARVSLGQLRQLESLIAGRALPDLSRDVQVWVQDVLARPIQKIVDPIIENSQALAQRLNRPVQIHSDFGDVRVRSQSEEMAMEFLVHILRNAIVHGLDEDRVAKGKNPEGQIHLRFSESSTFLRLEIQDDGRGFDRQYWEDKAQMISGKADSALKRLSWVELIELVSRGGHSTQTQVSMEAGRGVGLEGVIQAIRELGGHIHLESEAGRGSTFILDIKRPQATAAA